MVRVFFPNTSGGVYNDRDQTLSCQGSVPYRLYYTSTATYVERLIREPFCIVCSFQHWMEF